MKLPFSLSLGLCFFLALGLYLSSHSLYADDLDNLDGEDREWIVERLDDICPDLWCEGDFDIVFSDLSCQFSKRQCHLSLRLLSWDLYPDVDESHEDYLSPETHPRPIPYSCTLMGVASRHDMMVPVETAMGRGSLQDSFFDKVDDCVRKGQDHAARIMKETNSNDRSLILK